jgi:D-3-phosphoglycerate dehydrogenase
MCRRRGANTTARATPHIGGLTPPASESQAFDTVRQVEALVKGEVPPGAANPASWRRRPHLG